MSDDPTKKLADDNRLDELIALVRGMDARLRIVEAELQTVKAGLRTLDAKVDERLYDTRPLWEAVQTQMAELRADMERGLTDLRAEMEKGFADLRAHFEKELRHLGRQVESLAINLLKLDGYQRDLEARVGDLESKAS
ncbi:MAG TPA: hypothetical protein VJH03_10660 [Blastocatellia bacterium]|nr:hypothetical protein [Blastocatellia bacterium]